jgi:hypothetical protein
MPDAVEEAPVCIKHEPKVVSDAAADLETELSRASSLLSPIIVLVTTLTGCACGGVLWLGNRDGSRQILVCSRTRRKGHQSRRVALRRSLIIEAKS